MLELYQSLAHSRWNCKYHVVLVPKRRRQKWFGEIRRQLGPIFHELARQKACRMIESHVMPDPIHRWIEVPPNYAVASVIGLIKGKRAIAIARQFGGRDRTYSGEQFWARGDAVSTVGLELEQIKAYIRYQDGNDDGRF
jgi:putative transposase